MNLPIFTFACANIESEAPARAKIREISAETLLNEGFLIIL